MNAFVKFVCIIIAAIIIFDALKINVLEYENIAKYNDVNNANVILASSK